MFALESWATTKNNYNPMREEYFNTSLLVTEYGKGQGAVKKSGTQMVGPNLTNYKQSKRKR
jgi:hypothetical protein